MSEQDTLRRFIFENHNVRGEWVHLDTSLIEAKQHQQLVSPAIESQLGQALAAVALLSATIKFQGAMIMQIQGKGELTALVAQANQQQQIRGLVRSSDTVTGHNLKTLLGEGGRLVLTIESENGERYQGIVGVEADNLAQVLETYFQQSEQLSTRLWLFADPQRAAGLLLQELPGTANRDPQDWERIQILADTLTAEEMLSLDCETLLHRLFHEEQVRLYDPEPVAFRCSCSSEKISTTLVALGQEELKSIIHEHGEIQVDCQFCGAHYRFDAQDVERLIFDTPAVPTTLH